MRSGWRRCVCDARCESACECVRCVVCVGQSDLPTPPQELISIATQRSLQAGAHIRHTRPNVSSAQGGGKSSTVRPLVTRSDVRTHGAAFAELPAHALPLRLVTAACVDQARPRTRWGVSHDTAGPPQWRWW